MKLAVVDAVALRVCPRPRHEPCIALDADDVAPLRASGREKFPSPQNRSSTRSPGCGASSSTARATICA